MWDGLLISLVVYAVAALVVYRWDRENMWREKHHAQYFIYTDNNQKTIEGVVRRLRFRSSFWGKPTKITVIDLGSSDDTAPIVDRLARDPAVRWTRANDRAFADRLVQKMLVVIPEGRTVEVIDLRHGVGRGNGKKIR